MPATAAPTETPTRWIWLPAGKVVQARVLVRLRGGFGARVELPGGDRAYVSEEQLCDDEISARAALLRDLERQVASARGKLAHLRGLATRARREHERLRVADLPLLD